MMWWILCPILLLFLMMLIRQPEYTGGGLSVVVVLSVVSGFAILVFNNDATYERGAGFIWLIGSCILAAIYLVGGAIGVYVSFFEKDEDEVVRAPQTKDSGAGELTVRPEIAAGEYTDDYAGSIFPADLNNALVSAVKTLRESGMFDSVIKDWDADLLNLIVWVGSRAGSQAPTHAILFKMVSAHRFSSAQAEQVVTRVWASGEAMFRLPEFVKVAVSWESFIRNSLKGTIMLLTILSKMSAIAAAESSDRAALTAEEYIRAINRAIEEEYGVETSQTANPSQEQSLNTDPTSSSHSLLGVSASSTPAEVRAAYLEKVQLWHPDRLENMAPELRAYANQELAKINSAYEEILDNASA